MNQGKEDPTNTLTGVLEKILFCNEENHYMVGYLRHEENGNPVTTTIAGVFPEVQCGETLELTGNWKNHPKFGMQFNATGFRSTLPASVYGIRKYLGSGLVPGIGEVYAKKIVDRFGTETLNIISNHSQRLREIPGIGAQRAKAIKASWDEQQIFREVMIFLQTHGVTNAQCVRLVKRYGNDTIRILKNDPYILVQEVDGIGFITADRIAHNLGIPTNSPQRMDAGILTSLRDAADEGHTCLPKDLLLEKANALLDLDHELIRNRLAELIQARQLHSMEPDRVQLPEFVNAEERAAKAIRGILNTQSSLPPIKNEAAVDWFAEKAGFTLSDGQRSAIIQALSSKVSIITGGPGTGKTTLLKGIVTILKAKRCKVLLASPTGRASKRLAEATGGYAQTIHRLLGYDPAKGGFTSDEHHPLSADFVIVDEASMLDARLASALFRAVPYRAHLLLVGDTDQLPSVGAGNVLHDLIESGLVPVTRLEYVYRQVKGSEISRVAHGILHNQILLSRICDSASQIREEDDLVFVKTTSPELVIDTLISLLTEVLPRMLPTSWMREMQLLTPLHKGVAGTQNLNSAIQAALNPATQNQPSLRAAGYEFREGDRVIQVKNDYDKGVFNGDVGRVTQIDPVKSTMLVDFDGAAVTYERSDFGQIQLAYAISIHKSQGSEYPVVVIPLLKQQYIMLDRNLVYTAITRGKRKVYMVGEPEAFAMAVRNRRNSLRYTYLRERLSADKN